MRTRLPSATGSPAETFETNLLATSMKLMAAAAGRWSAVTAGPPGSWRFEQSLFKCGVLVTPAGG